MSLLTYDEFIENLKCEAQKVDYNVGVDINNTIYLNPNESGYSMPHIKIYKDPTLTEGCYGYEIKFPILYASEAQFADYEEWLMSRWKKVMKIITYVNYTTIKNNSEE